MADVLGVAGRNQERTAAFAEKYQIQKIYGKIEEVFADDQVDIVYIATPHNTHIQYLREALKAGKCMCSVRKQSH